MVEIALKQQEGFYSYWWKKNKQDDTLYKKLTFSKNFPLWNMVIGTGIYIDDIEKNIQKRHEELLRQLRDIIKTTTIGKTGYLYIFDSKANMIIHPNSNIDGKNIAKLTNPNKGTFLFDDLVEAVKNKTNVLYYKWDKPENPGKYIYDKVSWIEYVPQLDWYICSSAYVEDFEESSNKLQEYVFIFASFMILFSIGFSYIYLKKIFKPIESLTRLTHKVARGDYSEHSSVDTDDEIGALSKDFNKMLETIKDNVHNLDEKVAQKTKDLEETKKEVELILASILLPVLITSRKTRKIVYANKYAERQYDTKLEDIIGADMDDLYTAEGQQLHIIELLKTQGYVENLEEKFKTHIGKEFTALLSVIPITYKNDPSYIGMVTDITKQKNAEHKLREVNKHVKESIEYASLIQRALIPSPELFKKYFSDHFTLWHPKDIVGGDIYLFEELRSDDECMLMVVDCTGHGVPGAFVTMLVKAIERQVVAVINNNTFIEISPAWVLNYFNKTMKVLLGQETKDSISNAGFDGAVLYYNKQEKIVKFSGALTSLFYFDENDELITIKGSKHSVGYKTSNMDFEFDEHTIEVKDGMNFYITTDGYIDQNGGEKDFPFGKKRFTNILKENHNISFKEQKKILISKLKEYQQDADRNDDVTIVGIKI